MSFSIMNKVRDKQTIIFLHLMMALFHQMRICNCTESMHADMQ